MDIERWLTDRMVGNSELISVGKGEGR